MKLSNIRNKICMCSTDLTFLGACGSEGHILGSDELFDHNVEDIMCDCYLLAGFQAVSNSFPSMMATGSSEMANSISSFDVIVRATMPFFASSPQNLLQLVEKMQSDI